MMLPVHLNLCVIVLVGLTVSPFRTVVCSDGANNHFKINCDHIKCPRIDICVAPNQGIAEGNRVGGCCPGCVYIAGLNESCNSFESQCRNGLTCDEIDQVCVEDTVISKCIQRQERAKYLNGKSFCSNRAGKLSPTGFRYVTFEYQPDCNLFTGKFEPKQCKTSK